MPLDRFQLQQESSIKSISPENYQQASKKERALFLNKVSQLTNSKLLPDFATKAIYNILKGKIFPGNENFKARYQDYEKNFRPLIEQKKLPLKTPYFRSDRQKSNSEPYNKWLYHDFKGWRTQNTALIHFLVEQEKAKLNIPETEQNSKAKQEKISLSQQKRAELKDLIKNENIVKLNENDFKRETRAQKLRKSVFKDAENGDYTFLPQVGTKLHQTTRLIDLFPNEKTLTIEINHRRASRSRRLRRPGDKIVIVKRGNAFYPQNKGRYGYKSIEIWQGDKINLNKKVYLKENSDQTISDIPLKPKAVDSIVTEKTKDKILEKNRQKLGEKLDSEVKELSTDNVKIKLPQLKIKPPQTNSTHILKPEAVSNAGGEFNLNASGCAQFAFRLLGNVKGKELIKRGTFADAWTMYHSIREKERQDGVKKGSYVRMAGNLSLDHKYYYNRKKNLDQVNNKLLFNEDYIDDLSSLFKNTAKIVKKRGVAFITYYYHESGSTSKALETTKKLLKKGVNIYETTPTTHIELVSSFNKVSFLNKETLKEFKNTKNKSGKYLDLLLKVYIENHISKDEFPLARNPKNYRDLALKRLSILAKSGTKIFLKNQKGQEREIIMIEDGENYKLIDKKTKHEVNYNKANPETLYFRDIATKTSGITNNILKNFLLFYVDYDKNRSTETGRELWKTLPGKVLELPGIKWDKPKDQKAQAVYDVITKYSSINSFVFQDANIKSLQVLYKKNNITKEDLVFFNEGLRRVGIDASKLKKDSPIPIFDLEKLKNLFFEEALVKKSKNFRKEAREKLQNYNKKIAAIKSKKEKNELIKERDKYIKKIALPQILIENLRAASLAAKEFFSPKGVETLNKQIGIIERQIKQSEDQIFALKNEPGIIGRRYRVSKATKYKGLLERRKLKLTFEKIKLEDILAKYIVVPIIPGAGKISLLREISKQSEYFKKTKLLPEEKRFIISYIDKINQNIDLTVIKRGKYEAYKDWHAGEVIFLDRESLVKLESIIKLYRNEREKHSKVPSSITCGKDKYGKLIHKEIAPNVKAAIEYAADKDPVITKLLLYTYAQEQGRGESRKKWKQRLSVFGVTNSYGLFQVRANIFTYLSRGGEFGISERKRIIKPEFRKLFGVESYEDFVNKLKTDDKFNAKVAAYVLKSNIGFVKHQLKNLGIRDQIDDDSPLMHTMVLSSYNRGPNTTTRGIVNYRVEQLRKIFPLVKEHYDQKDQKHSLTVLSFFPSRISKADSFSQFIKKYGANISRWKLAKMKLLKDFSKINSGLARVGNGLKYIKIATQPVEDAYKIYKFALELKKRYPKFTKLSEKDIEKQSVSFIKRPANFIKTQLYQDFASFAQKNPESKTFNWHKTTIKFSDLYTKNVGREFSYGFVVTRDGQHENISRNIFKTADLLKFVPKTKPAKTPETFAMSN